MRSHNICFHLEFLPSRPQHLTGLQLICDICQGRLQGAEVKSTEITFYPGVVKAGNFLADTHTAG